MFSLLKVSLYGRLFNESLTYQVLPLICDTVRGTTGHIVVVVLPIVNLMKDQATKLANIGIPAQCNAQ